MRVKKVFADPHPPDFNVAPTSFQPIVRQEREPEESGTPEREMLLARWGLVPWFVDSLAAVKGVSTINARAEGIATARTWREPFKKRRCLVPVDGFYEWKKLDESPKPKKQPYAIALADGDVMALAGLWDAWKDPNGGWLQSFSIITTEANEIMAPIHTRMPVILPERDWARWLDRGFGAAPGEVEQLVALLRPFDSEAMQAHPCNPAVGSVRNNGPEMLTCPVAGELPLNSA